MSLAQEKEFRPKSAFRKKMAWDMPTRSVSAAERAIPELRRRFEKANKKEKKEMLDLMFEASRALIHMAKNKRRFSRAEQTAFYRMSLIYARLKTEFAKEVK